MIKCSICNYENKNNIPHYCSNCGNNISDQIEKQDIILFISNLFKALGIIGIFLITFPMTACAINPFCIDGTCIGKISNIVDWIIMILPVFFIIISYIIKRYFKKLCALNIKKQIV